MCRDVFRGTLGQMEIDLDGKRVLLIGANQILGYTCAEVLASEGCSLALAGGNIKDLKEVTTDLRSNYEVSITSHAGEVSDVDWQHSVLAVVTPLDSIVVDVSAFFDLTLFVENDEDESKALAAVTQSLQAIFSFAQTAASGFREDGEGIFIFVMPTLGYLTSDPSATALWETSYAAVQKFSATYAAANNMACHSLFLSAEADELQPEIPGTFEYQIADFVAYAMTEKGAPFADTAMLLHQR